MVFIGIVRFQVSTQIAPLCKSTPAHGTYVSAVVIVPVIGACATVAEDSVAISGPAFKVAWSRRFRGG